MTFVLDVVQVFISVMLVFLILMHSGKDSGLSGFGMGSGSGGGGSQFGGGSLVERNLNRWTILFAVLLPVNTIVLSKVS
jgi:preprotein translocase subunit SecG